MGQSSDFLHCDAVHKTSSICFGHKRTGRSVQFDGLLILIGNVMDIKSLLKRTAFAAPFAVLAYSSAALAVPSPQLVQTLSQPDGSTISGKLMGDEYVNWYQTSDGKVFLYNSNTNTFEYAVVADLEDGTQSLELSGVSVRTSTSPASIQSFAETNFATASDAKKLLSSFHSKKQKSAALFSPAAIETAPAAVNFDFNHAIIMVEFSDYQVQSEDSVWSNKIFGTEPGTVSHYYNEISSGKVNFAPATESYGTPDDGIIKVQMTYPNPNLVVNENAHLEQGVIEEAISKADQYIDFSSYDSNYDGNITPDELALTFILSGPEGAITKTTGTWAHVTYFAGTIIVDGKTVNQRYTAMGERQWDHDATIGVIAHEWGHQLFNLPDLYEGEHDIGKWGLMGSSWGQCNQYASNAAGGCPAHMTGYSKLRSGFYDPQVVEINQSPVTVDLFHHVDGNFNIVKIPVENTEDYFILENRQFTSYDASLKNAGAMSNGGVLLSYKPARGDFRILRSDKTSADHSQHMFFKEHIDRIDPDTNPNTRLDDGTRTDLVITDVSSPSNVMSATIGGYNYCEDVTATNSQHEAAGRAYKESSGGWWWAVTYTYYAVGTGEELGSSTETTTLSNIWAGEYTTQQSCPAMIAPSSPVINDFTLDVNAASANLRIDVSDVDGDISIIEYKLDSNEWVEFAVYSGAQTNVGKIIDNLTIGNHQVVARVIDKGGRTVQSEVISFEITAQNPPTCSIDSVDIESAANITITGSSSDPDADLEGLDLVLDSTTNLGVYFDSGSGSWGNMFTFSPALEAGEHTLVATVVDHAENTGTCTKTFTIEYSEPKPPTCEIISASYDHVDNRLVIEGSMSDPNSNIEELMIELDADGNLKPASLNGQTRWGLVLSEGFDNSVGTHSVKGYISDSSGLQSTCESTVEIAPPGKPVISELSISTKNNTVTIEGSATDTEDDIERIEVEFDNSGDWLTLNGTYYFKTEFEVSEIGLHTLKVRGVDQTGQIGEVSGPHSFEIFVATAPTCEIESLTVTTKTAAIEYRGKIIFSDVNNNLEEGQLLVKLSDHNDWHEKNMTTAEHSMIDSSILNEIPPGIHTFYAKVIDESGLETDCGYVEYEVVDLQEAPTCEITKVELNNNILTVYGYSADANTNLAETSISVDGGELMPTSHNQSFADYHWSKAIESAPGEILPGEHTVVATVNDGLGNVGNCSITFTVEPEGNQCFTSSNTDHVAAGRAELRYNILVYANGSQNYLGMGTNTTSLEETSPGYWTKVTSCP